MRHRIIGNIFTGLGNSEDEILINNGKLNSDFCEDIINNYFKDIGGFDFTINFNHISVGIEPSYQYDVLKIIKICKNKEQSSIRIGISFGPYGSNVCSTLKIYSQYKNKSKFVKFVDKWHSILFPQKDLQ